MRKTIKVSECKHPRYTHRVRFYNAAGERFDRYFSNSTDAETFAAERRKELGDVGASFAGMTEPERAALVYWRALTDRTKGNPPPALLEILTDYGKRWEAAQKGATVATAVESYLRAKRGEIDGKESSHTLALKTRLGKFARDFGPRNLATISTAEVSDWILGLAGSATPSVRQAARGRPAKSGPLSMQTKKNHRLAVHAFFAWAKSRSLVGANPVTESAKPKVPKKAPGILKPAKVGVFLAAIAGTPSIVPFWTIRIFAGIRESEVVRMTWEMVDLGKLKINLPATVTKTGRPRGVDIQPALAAFLKRYAKKAGFIAPQSEMARRHALSKAILPKGFNLPRNWARHTFATMHLHHFQDAGKTSLQLGHGESPEMLNAHYAAYATDEEAAAFWKIRPDTLPQPGNVVPLNKPAPEATKPATVKPRRKRA